MTDMEADKFGISREDRRRFFRADDAKPNRAPQGSAQWFQMVSVHLDNGPDGGDNVGVATGWVPPNPFAGVTIDHVREAQKRIGAGEWREHRNSPNWAGGVVAEILGLDLEDKAAKAKVVTLLADWTKRGWFEVEIRRCPKREQRKFLIVGKPA